MDPAQANLAFQVISERYEYHRSTCITTNRLFKDWPKVFPDALNAQVIAERFTERAEASSSTERAFDRRRTPPDFEPLDHHARLCSVARAFELVRVPPRRCQGGEPSARHRVGPG
jgi:hypothetical protein